MKEKMQELSVAFAQLDEKLKKIKADDYSKPDENKMMMEDMMAMCRNLSARIDYLSNASWDYQYNHSKGHLPPIRTSAQMEKALKSCGMEGEYDIYKPSISVASNNKGMIVTASYEKKK